jgi:hypothetical protein
VVVVTLSKGPYVVVITSCKGPLVVIITSYKGLKDCYGQMTLSKHCDNVIWIIG